MGSWAQELALRRVATQRKTGCGDHELDPVSAAEWPWSVRLSKGCSHAPADAAREWD